MWIFRALAEVIAPSSCAACDESIAPNALFCGVCAVSAERTPDPAGVFCYGGAVQDAILRFKFRGRSDLAAMFARAMVRIAPPNVDIVVPVPIHPRRLVTRGYNQASLLAGPIARAIGRPFAPRALARVRDTPMQSSLDRAARVANLERAFIGRDFINLRGRTVLLVDDVRTTGSTLRACADTLHEVGAARVLPLVLACRDGTAL